METININANVPFVIGRHRDTRLAVLAQNASATEPLLAGTLLTPDADGKLGPCVPADSDNNVDATYPVCALLADVTKEAIKADDVEAYVVYNTILNKELIATVNSDLEIDETFIWEAIKNGLDIKAMEK